MTPVFWVLLGPTAVGKTRTSLLIADRVAVEVVNLDSRQVYKRLDIGTAKPTREEQIHVPHHMVGIIEPDERLDAFSYARNARVCILDIIERDRIPLVVGGSGFYLNAILGEFSEDLPAGNDAVRKQLTRSIERDGIETLWKKLELIDPSTASRLKRTDTARIIRALEIYNVTGETLSDMNRKYPPKPWGSPRIAVLHMNRTRLKERIRLRIDSMLNAGWFDEVQSLIQTGYREGSPAMNGLGYEELLEVSRGNLDINTARKKIYHRTWRYAKRQFTWFRRYPKEWWFDVEDQDVITNLLAYFQSGYRA